MEGNSMKQSDSPEIPDEALQAWKAAMQRYIENKQIGTATPENTFWLATTILLTNQQISAYAYKKQLQRDMLDAINNHDPIFTNRRIYYFFYRLYRLVRSYFFRIFRNKIK
jgi:hypothetical protein